MPPWMGRNMNWLPPMYRIRPLVLTSLIQKERIRIYELEADTWLYFKAVLLVKLDSTKGTSFIGVGFGKFTPEAPIMDENGEVIGTIPESVRVSYASALREDYEFSTEKFESEYFYKRQYKYSYKITDTLKIQLQL